MQYTREGDDAAMILVEPYRYVNEAIDITNLKKSMAAPGAKTGGPLGHSVPVGWKLMDDNSTEPHYERV